MNDELTMVVANVCGCFILQDMKHYQLYEGNCHCSLASAYRGHAPIKLDGQH